MVFSRFRILADAVNQSRFGAIAPGVLAAVAIALMARLIAGMVLGLPDVLVALAIGIAIRNLFGAEWGVAGGKAVVRYVLRAAIILIGGGLTVGSVAARGLGVLGVVIGLVVLAFALGIALARLARLTKTMAPR